MISRIATISLLTALTATGSVQARDAKPPSHPSKLTYDSLVWQAPLGAPYRTTLSNGLRTYIAEDHTLPMVEIVGEVRGGTIFDPKGKEGLGGLAVGLMRTGGTKKYPADSLDALLDRLAIRLSLGQQQSVIEFRMAFLSDYTDTALGILEQVLFHPAFEQAKVVKEKTLAIEDIRHRFDNPEPVLGAASTKAMYPSQANSRLPTEKSVTGIVRTDLVDFHKRAFRTANIILAVSGDLRKDTVASRLSAIFPKATAPAESLVTDIKPRPAERLLIVQRTTTQAYVRMGLPLFKRPNPDYYAVTVLNLILGDGGFTSRLTTRVRSDEGLTYSIHSNAESNYAFPGLLTITFFTKTATTSRAIELCLEEVRKLLKDGITDKELSDAKATLIDGFPSSFRNVGDVVEKYAWNEYYARPDSIFVKYPAEIRRLTRDDVLRVAKKYLKPDSLTYVVVGDTAGIFAADTLKAFSLRALAPRKVITTDGVVGLP
jgi:predicted Zn-dependent peptidase